MELFLRHDAACSSDNTYLRPPLLFGNIVYKNEWDPAWGEPSEESMRIARNILRNSDNKDFFLGFPTTSFNVELLEVNKIWLETQKAIDVFKAICKINFDWAAAILMQPHMSNHISTQPLISNHIFLEYILKVDYDKPYLAAVLTRGLKLSESRSYVGLITKVYKMDFYDEEVCYIFCRSYSRSIGYSEEKERKFLSMLDDESVSFLINSHSRILESRLKIENVKNETARIEELRKEKLGLSIALINERPGIKEFLSSLSYKWLGLSEEGLPISIALHELRNNWDSFNLDPKVNLSVPIGDAFLERVDVKLLRQMIRSDIQRKTSENSKHLVYVISLIQKEDTAWLLKTLEELLPDKERDEWTISLIAINIREQSLRTAGDIVNSYENKLKVRAYFLKTDITDAGQVSALTDLISRNKLSGVADGVMHNTGCATLGTREKFYFQFLRKFCGKNAWLEVDREESYSAICLKKLAPTEAREYMEGDERYVNKITSCGFTLMPVFLCQGTGYALRVPISGGSYERTKTAYKHLAEINKYAESVIRGVSSDTAVLTLQTDDRAIKDELGEELEYRFNGYERGALLSMIHSPSKSRGEIEARQNAIDAFRNLPESKQDRLLESKKAMYEFTINLYNLVGNQNRDEFVLLAKKSGYDAAKFIKLLEGQKQDDRTESILKSIRESVSVLPQYKDCINDFLKEFETVDDPLVIALVGILKSRYREFNIRDFQDVLTFLRDRGPEAVSELTGYSLDVLSVGVKIGLFFEFANFIKENEYCKASFDSAKPVFYQDGWNFMRKKKGQIKNPSGTNATIKLLTGSNMSGKSFFLVQNLFIQLLGQSFGFIPAASGNLRIYDQIVFIDRAATDATMNLSAFGSEVGKWKNTLDTIGNKALYLVDEGFSTTSPDDQAKLLAGASDLFRDNNAHAILATHNEQFIMGQQKKPGTVVYHFEAIINKVAFKQKDESEDSYDDKKKGPITFTHKLKDGFDDSKALEVAKQLGLQKSLIDRSKDFLAGKPGPIKVPRSKTTAEIKSYTPGERIRLKKKLGNFLPFFPYEDVLEEREDTPVISGESKPLQWRYGNASEEAMYRDRSGRKLNFNPVFTLFSGDRDFSPWSITNADYGILRNSEVLESIHLIIMSSPSRDPREILERQRMFKAILSDKESFKGGDWKVSMMIGNIGSYLEGFQLSEASPIDRFNLYMLLESLQEIERFDATQARTDLFLKILDMNLKLNGSSLEKIGVSDELSKISDIWKLQKEMRDFENKYTFNKTNENDPEMPGKRKRIYDELKRLTGIERWSTIEYGAGDIVKKILIDIFRKATGVDINEGGNPGLLIEFLKESESVGTLKAVSAFEPENWDIAEKALGEIMEAVRNEKYDGMGIFISDYIRFSESLRALLCKEDTLTEFVAWLKSYDSVHLHQIANYYEFILRPIVGKSKNGREYLAELKKIKIDVDKAKAEKEKWQELSRSHDYASMLSMAKDWLQERYSYLSKLSENDPGYYGRKDEDLKHIKVLLEAAQGVVAIDEASVKQEIEKFLKENYGRSLENSEFSARYTDKRQRRRHLDGRQIWPEISKLFKLFSLAFIIEDNRWKEVAFTDNPELSITNAWSVVKTKSEQVRNSARFGSGEMARLFSGSNMSGKTFHMKQLIWAILSAQATGFAPCDNMTSPIFDKVLYIDRVKAESDRNISSFGLEVEYWKRFFDHASTSGLVFGAIDEAGSTTSPKYQSALSYAIADEMLALGNMLAMASHNHDFLDAFHEANKDRTAIYHLKTHETEDGGIIFDYVLEKGHASSNAIKVAEQLGLGMVTRFIKSSL
jgi:DNA mismatch repair ATPase MutS